MGDEFAALIATYGFFVFLFWVVVIVVHCLVCKVFKEIAAEKGWTDRSYFAWVFFTGIFGALMVVALPDKKARVNNALPSGNNVKYVAGPAPAPVSTVPPAPYADPGRQAYTANNGAKTAADVTVAASEIQIYDRMLQEGKITADEYQTMVAAYFKKLRGGING